MWLGISIRMVAAPEKGQIVNGSNPKNIEQGDRMAPPWSRVVLWFLILKLTGGVCVHDRLHVVAGKDELVAEEERPDEGQLLELLERDGVLQQLPLRLQREELVDELLGVCQEVVVVVLVP